MTRQDVPWAYMVPIAPILEDIKRELETDDVRLPTELDFASPLITSYKPSVNVDTDELCSRMTETPTNESPTASMSTNEVRVSSFAFERFPIHGLTQVYRNSPTGRDFVTGNLQMQHRLWKVLARLI